MKRVIILDEEDICAIIAKEYYTNVANVTLDTYSEWDGYGPTEHEVIKVEVRVEDK